MRQTRPISWIKAARKDFEKFPAPAQAICWTALTIAAEGGKSDIVKPLMGLGSAVFEIALPHRGDAFRVVYAVQLGEDIWSSMPSRRNRLRESKLRSMRSISSRIG